MKRFNRRSPVLLAAIIVPALAAAAAPHKKPAAATSFEAVKMIIEFNSTAQDAGVQVSFDAEAWKSVTVLDPDGHKIFQVDGKGSLRQLGGSELFLESDEPALQDVPLDNL